jgi:hypothetical protein
MISLSATVGRIGIAGVGVSPAVSAARHRPVRMPARSVRRSIRQAAVSFEAGKADVAAGELCCIDLYRVCQPRPVVPESAGPQRALCPSRPSDVPAHVPRKPQRATRRQRSSLRDQRCPRPTARSPSPILAPRERFHSHRSRRRRSLLMWTKLASRPVRDPPAGRWRRSSGQE